jgi:hypothetical protein
MGSRESGVVSREEAEGRRQKAEGKMPLHPFKKQWIVDSGQ